jgi:hypothetical protein
MVEFVRMSEVDMDGKRTAGCLLVLSVFLTSGSEVALAETQRAEGGKGITVDDLGRGLKSAAHNVEKEIPKIGPAVAETFRKLSGNGSNKKPAQEASKDKK